VIRTLALNAAGDRIVSGDENAITAWQQARARGASALLWVDVSAEPPEQEAQLLCEVFGVHELAVQDAQRVRHPPKIERFDNNLFIILKGLDAQSETTDFDTIQISIFAARDFLLTRHEERSLSIDRLWAQLSEHPAVAHAGALALALRIARYVVDRYVAVLHRLEQRLDALEEQTLAEPRDELLFELARYRAQLTRLRRVLAYHAQVFGMGRADLDVDFEGRKLKHEVNDVIEQLDRASNLATLYYDLCADLMSSYISLASHRLNGIMKVLTIITAIFVPLSFVAGVYGMNFEHMPELHSRYGYYFVLALMLALATSLLVAFRMRRWL
jgi:magnesium transporter